MGTINITQYDQTPGAQGDANQINSAFSAIQTVINGNIEDVNIKAGAAIAASKIAFGGNWSSFTPTWQNVTLGNGTTVGRKL